MKHLAHIGVIKDSNASAQLTTLCIKINYVKNRLQMLKYEYGLIFNINYELPIDYQELGAIRELFNKEVLIYKECKRQYREIFNASK